MLFQNFQKCKNAKSGLQYKPHIFYLDWPAINIILSCIPYLSIIFILFEGYKY